MKMDPSARFVLNTLLVLIILPLAASGSCPRPCSCPQATELHCTFRSLVTIPAAIPKHVKHMNLGFNKINKITDKSLAGLRKLELLMVHGNDIHELPDGVFRELISLQMLKISYNKLKEISRRTLHGLWSVARLHLDHNQLEFIHPDAFQGLTSLRLLQLEGNQLQQLHPETFTTFTVKSHFHVSTLRHLYLSDNGLMSLPSRLVATMPQLENLYLDRNPWSCDCRMRWLHDWDKKSPGVLKCKKDRSLPSGQLCPMCSSPRHLQTKDLLDVENLVCNSPVITFPHRMTTLKDAENEDLATEDFKESFGNISLALSDEHGNEVDLECSISKSRELTKITWEQNNQVQLTSNITVTVDLECPVDREKYEKLWRLIAYYSNIPAHLERRIILSKDPHPTYLYRQDSEKDALYYTGVKVNMMAQPAWLMQTSVALQLNRLQSSATMAKLIMSTNLSETVEAELMQKQRRSWVMIESINTTRKVFSAILGKQSQMSCNVHSSGQTVIRWMLPDGSKVEAPYSSPDDRLSVSSGGSLVIKAVHHSDTGIYYCIARSHGDFAVLPFYLTVQESSSPPPGDETSITPNEGFAGNPIFLPCTASGSPDAEINWILPSSNIVSFQANSPRALVHSNGTLHIPQSQLSDSGYYKCIAMNQHGVDTLTTKITVIRHKGLIKPLRKFPATPQSASGVNTQIKIPTQNADEASEDTEVTQDGGPKSHQDPLRRRTPGGVAPGRRGIHPSRNIRRRPPLLQKPTGSRVVVRMNAADRRRINMAKGKIDPQKWAHILAKIRDRKTQNTATPLPTQHTNERTAAEQTAQSEDTTEGSSDDVTEQEKQGQDFLRTLHTPVQHTQMKTNKQHAHSQGTQVTSDSNSTHNAHLISHSQHSHSMHSTTEPHMTQSIYSVEYITHNTVLEHTSSEHTSSDSVFFLPQTTSVPLHAVTFWQSLTNTASSTFSLHEKQSTNTDVNTAVKTADWSKLSERHYTTDRLNVVASSSNDNEPFSRSHIIPSANPSKSMTGREGKGKYPSETVISQLQSLEDTQSAATASPTTTGVLMTSRSRASERRPTPRQQHNSRRRNGSQRRRPNRRKQKLIKPTPFIAVTSAKALLATVKTPAFTRLKIVTTEVTTANPSTTVPFTGSQTASSGRVSHKESTVSRHDHGAATKASSLPASPIKTKDSHLPSAKPLFKSTSTATSLPTTVPEVDHRKTTSQAALGISESPSPLEHFSVPTSAPLHRFISSTAPPVSLSEETQRPNAMGDLDPLLSSDSLSVAVYTTNTTPLQRGCDETQSCQQYTTNEEMLLKETEVGFSQLPSTFTTDSTFIDQVIKTTSGYTSKDLTTTPSTLDVDTTQTPTEPQNLYYSSTESKAVQNPKEALNEKVNFFSPTISAFKTTTPPPTTSRFDRVLPVTITLHPTLPEISFTEAKKDSSMQEAPRITVSHSEDQQIKPNINKSEPWGESNVHPTTKSPDHKPPSSSPAVELTSRQVVIQTATPAPNATAQTNLYREALLTSTQAVSRKYQVPKQESVPRAKPRITKSSFQAFAVKVEADAQLPCETEGDPKPSLSWTKVASGASIAQNTTVQRFEVHPNGTLIIRNTQLLDSGQYLCTVQNQYGTDMMVVNLVVLSQHPRVLHPRHREITVHLGGKVNLECKVEGHPVPQVTWVLPNHVHMAAASVPLPSQQHVVVTNNGILQINQASYTDSGIYKCIASSAAGADSVSVRLHVLVLPPVIQQSLHETTTLSEGNPAYIHCTATGSPPSVIRWITPDGAQLTASLDIGQNLIVFPNGTLYIRSVGTGNAGRYECSASNTVASSRRTVILSIRKNLSSAKPNITSSSPQRTDVIYGSKLLLNCVATGQPKPRIIWRTPSKKLVDAQYSFDSRIKVFPNGTFSLHSVTDKDGGDYLCVARNKMGDDYILLRVNVLTRPAKIEQKLQQSSQEVVYGADLKVDCVASGLPNPEISWMLPDGTMVNLVKQTDGIVMGRSRRYVVFDNGTLYFNNIRMPEEGDYTCYAENQLGKDEMKVRVKIKAAPSPPQIHNKDPQTVRVFYGETATLRCKAKGEPAPVVTWISPINKVISPALDKYQTLDDGTLVVQKIQRFDGGNYTCIARNSAGQDQKVTRLEVLVTPPVISGLRGTSNAIKVTAVQNQQKLLDCMANGTPTPHIMWVLPGNLTLPAPYYSKRILVHQNGTLEIRSAKETDSGQLVCIARNEGGEVRLVVNLDVKTVVERPQIRGPKTNVQLLTVGSPMALNCFFEGSALLPVTWILPSGASLHSGARFSKFFHQPNGSLIISNPSVADAGMYRCLIHNSGEVVGHTVTLSPGRKPEISNSYNSPISVINGENLLLHCQTTGEALRLAWTLPSGVVLNRVQRAGRYSVLPNGTLAIQQVSGYDRGAYTCRASNEYGSSLLSVSVIVVAYPPRITNGPPSVTYAKRGVAVQLNCVATGIPKVEVTWETPDKVRLAVSAQPHLFGNKYLHPQGSLIIQNPTQRDTGIYQCTARNAIGMDSKATFLNVF